MAYNNYFPQYYPQQSFVPAQMTTQQHNPGITWVQGENAAKSYPVSAGQSILLMDSENPVMYIKSTDQSGMPLPLRVFDYKERIQTPTDASQSAVEQKVSYISREEFETFRDEIRAELKQNKPITSTKTVVKEK